MKLGVRGHALIRSFEGCRLYPYLDTGGVWTVGIGHTEQAVHFLKLRRPITNEEAEALFARDVSAFEEGVTALKLDLTQNQFDALVSFSFNLGLAALKRSTLLVYLRLGDKVRAADEFRRWVYDNGKRIQGLVRRREAERALFLLE